VGVGGASNHAEFFPLPCAPSRLGEGGNTKTSPCETLAPSRLRAYKGRFFTTACERKRYIPSPWQGEGEGGGAQGAHAVEVPMSQPLPPSQPSPLKRGEGVLQPTDDEALTKNLPLKAPSKGGVKTGKARFTSARPGQSR